MHKRTLVFYALAMATVSACGAMASQQDGESTIVLPEEAMQKLELFLGPWNLKEHHYDSSGKIIATVKGTEDVKWGLNKRVIQRRYYSSSETSAFEAEGMLTWNALEKAYQGAWFDNASVSGPTIVRGRWDSERRAMVLSYRVQTGADTNRTFDVIDRFVDEKTRIATTFETTGGDVVKRMEVEYERAKPCPGAIRSIFDGL